MATDVFESPTCALCQAVLSNGLAHDDMNSMRHEDVGVLLARMFLLAEPG